MADKLYELMDWPRIEAVVYSEENAPREILGPHLTRNGVLIQCFFPDSEEVTVEDLDDHTTYAMTCEDEAGYFAALIPKKKIFPYKLSVKDAGGKTVVRRDPYAFPCQISLKEEQQFGAGICYTIYEKLGAHPMEVDGVKGTYFAVWAPNAQRVSVVGDFNGWDGRVYPMNLLAHSGIFELFIPELPLGTLYKYELKVKGGVTFLRSDPYASAGEKLPGTASVTADLSGFRWGDERWMKRRANEAEKEKPVWIYELHPGSFKKSDDLKTPYLNFRTLAPILAKYISEIGFTHVELFPMMEYRKDESWGYETTGYYAPTSRYGTPEDFMYFIDTLHRADIGVLMDWTPAWFSPEEGGMAGFDGTCLYEHLDPRQGVHPFLGTHLYNYGRPQVKNFLIANALFWAKTYHLDGLRMDSVDCMLYLDYGRQNGQWVSNIYGGNENLDAVEFLKHLNSIFKKKLPDVLLIAEDDSGWPQVTGSVEDDCLGFDYKWDNGWKQDLLGYLSYDPVFRGAHHGDLTLSMVYQYFERFLLSFSHKDVEAGKGSLYERMPGDEKQKLANLRAAYGYMLAHPGKKQLFMGDEFGQKAEWSGIGGLDWEEMKEEPHEQLRLYLASLLELYRKYPAFYQMDFDPDGFEWINQMDATRNMLTFLRRTRQEEDTMLVVCNFSNVAYEGVTVGVPYPGKYKEILNSDAEKFGGGGFVNPRVKMAKKKEWDEREYSVNIKVAPLSVSIFAYSKAVEKEVDNKTAKSHRKTPVKRGRSLKKELEAKMS